MGQYQDSKRHSQHHLKYLLAYSAGTLVAHRNHNHKLRFGFPVYK